MSDDEKKKLLGGLFENELKDLAHQGDTEAVKKPAKSEEKHSSTGGAGLSTLEILTLPADQRKIISLLSRKRQLTFDEIQQELKQDHDQVRKVMDQLKAANYLYEAFVDGQISYRVVFRNAPRRKGSGLLGDLWAKVDVDKGTFLRGVSLFDGLNELAIDEV